jgi:hypothetical protein
VKVDLEAHGWTLTPDGWKPPASWGLAGRWGRAQAEAHTHAREAFSALSERGWDVPGEYRGERVATLGRYVRHPVHAPRFVVPSTALRREGLPPLHPSTRLVGVR